MSASASAAPALPIRKPFAARWAKAGPEGEAYSDEKGRLAWCDFVKWGTERDERRSFFTITAPTGKAISHVQTYQAYYDATGRHLEDFPSSVSLEAEPQALGFRGGKIPKTTATVECEVTRIYFEDGTEWFNDNLIASGRPLGGFSDDELAKRTGEVVRVTSVDPRSGAIAVENLTDKDVTYCDIKVFWFRADGTHEDGWGSFFGCKIPAKKTLRGRLELHGFESLGKGAPLTVAEGTAPKVHLSNDTVFENVNLGRLPKKWQPKKR